MAEMVPEIVERSGAAVPPERRRPALESLGRMLAMLLLPLSIAPVLLLGPGLLRAPVALFNEGWGEARRLERQILPAQRRPAPLGENAWALPAVSLGEIYGRWSAFPAPGRIRPGDRLLGPEGVAR